MCRPPLLETEVCCIRSSGAASNNSDTSPSWLSSCEWPCGEDGRFWRSESLASRGSFFFILVAQARNEMLSASADRLRASAREGGGALWVLMDRSR